MSKDFGVKYCKPFDDSGKVRPLTAVDTSEIELISDDW
jgi:hypothetical protein